MVAVQRKSEKDISLKCFNILVIKWFSIWLYNKYVPFLNLKINVTNVGTYQNAGEENIIEMISLPTAILIPGNLNDIIVHCYYNTLVRLHM